MRLVSRKPEPMTINTMASRQANRISTLALFAKREPSADSSGQVRRKDVVLYLDRERTKPCARYPWYLSNTPSRRHRTVMHNCFRFQLVWD